MKSARALESIGREEESGLGESHCGCSLVVVADLKVAFDVIIVVERVALGLPNADFESSSKNKGLEGQKYHFIDTDSQRVDAATVAVWRSRPGNREKELPSM